jgi:hypothetical protein
MCRKYAVFYVATYVLEFKIVNTLCVLSGHINFLFSESCSTSFFFSSNLFVICPDIIVCNAIYQLLATTKIVQLTSCPLRSTFRTQNPVASVSQGKWLNYEPVASYIRTVHIHIEFWFLLDVAHKSHLQICAQEIFFLHLLCLGNFHCIHVGHQN